MLSLKNGGWSSVFLKTFESFVAIFCLSGSFVAQALAGPGPVRYELGVGAAQLFVINNATGNITIQSHIDREVCSEKRRCGLWTLNRSLQDNVHYFKAKVNLVLIQTSIVL